MYEIKLFTVPNCITLLNLISGFSGIIFCLKGNTGFACYSIFAAAFFDFLDGFAARLFNSSSEMGKQLDSLCDVISFGALPGLIMYQILVEYREVALLIPVFSALRLAKFNLDNRQSDQFIGVPTPMNAFFISGIALVFPDISNFETNLLIIFFIISSSFLLIAEFPLLSIKFKTYKIEENVIRYLLIFFAVVLWLILKSESFIILYFVYLGLSFINNFISKRNVLYRRN